MTLRPLHHYLIGATLAASAINLPVRLWLRLGGFAATLISAALVAALLITVFWRHEKRLPSKAERRLLIGGYALLLGLLYAGLYVLMSLKDESMGLAGQLIFASHYLCYPLMLWGGFVLAQKMHSTAH